MPKQEEIFKSIRGTLDEFHSRYSLENKSDSQNIINLFKWLFADIERILAPADAYSAIISRYNESDTLKAVIVIKSIYNCGLHLDKLIPVSNNGAV